jgi:nucleotide-binding universal stress UspA family protein
MRIMVCYHYASEEAEECLNYAKKQALAYNGEVLVVSSHVVDDKDYPKRIVETEQGLRNAKAFFNRNHIPCETLLAYRDFDNDAGEHLVSIALEHHIDEIIVGIRVRSKVGKFIMGSEAQKILLSANCPVVGIRKK